MTLSLHHIVIDAHDLPRWLDSGVRFLGWKVLPNAREVVIGTDVNRVVGICLMPAGDEKSVKTVSTSISTRVAMPGLEDREAEIRRILALGARRVDIGQTGDESWTVLADPEGNEFCIVRPKGTLIG